MQKHNINLYDYPFQLGKTGIENQFTPVKSVHSTIWLLNWILMKGSYQYTFRWDADFIMSSQLARELKFTINDDQYNIYNIGAIFLDDGKVNIEPYFWDNDLRPRYVRYSLWHLAKFGKKYKKPGNLQGRIVHDSSLNEFKSYWDTPPWWENQSKSDIPEMAKMVKKQYIDLKHKLGDEITTRARASCPESEELTKIVQGLIGADVAEIEELECYTNP